MVFSLDEDSFFSGACSATLISDKWGITAGHCVELLSNTPTQTALIAAQDFGAPDAGQSSISIARYIRHPDFQLLTPEPDQSIEDFFASFGDDISPTEVVADIAIFELAQAIDLEASGLTTIRLADATPSKGMLATSPAYGRTRPNSHFGVLTEDHLPIQGGEFCEADEGIEPRPFNTETQICGGYAEGGFSTCPGDSGAPLIIKDPTETTWLLAGITSYAPSCGVGADVSANTPSYFMSIPFYKSWVEANAREPSVALNLELELELGMTYSENNFANTSTLKEFTTETILKDRYQLTTATATVIDNSVQIHTLIRDESEAGRNFQCTLSLLPSQKVDYTFDCPDERDVEIINNIATGIYTPILNVALNEDDPDKIERGLAQPYIIIGDTTQSSIDGALTNDDSTDFGALQDRFFDAFTLTIDTFSSLTAIDIISGEVDFDLFIIDRDIFEKNNGNLEPALIVESNTVNQSGLTFLPKEGVNYAMIVRAFDIGNEGKYQLILRNDVSATELESFSFSSP